jgi:hypothetical protein
VQTARLRRNPAHTFPFPFPTAPRPGTIGETYGDRQMRERTCLPGLFTSRATPADASLLPRVLSAGIPLPVNALIESLARDRLATRRVSRLKYNAWVPPLGTEVGFQLAEHTKPAAAPPPLPYIRMLEFPCTVSAARAPLIYSSETREKCTRSSCPWIYREQIGSGLENQCFCSRPEITNN